MLLPLLIAAALSTSSPTLKQAQALLWSGETAQAEAALETLLRAEPQNVQAMIHLSEARRWSGRPMEAQKVAEAAVALDPDHPGARYELAWTLADQGSRGRARSVLEAGGLSAEGPLAERLAALEALRPSLALTVFGDSYGVVRTAPRARFALALPGDFELVVGGGRDTLRLGTTQLERNVAGAQLSAEASRAQLFAAVAMHQGSDALMVEASGKIVYRLSDKTRVGASLRRRPFLAPAEPLATGVESFHSAGGGGASDLLAMAQRGVDDLQASVVAAPFRGAYLYSELRLFEVTDKNRGYSFAGGLGVDLLQLVGLRSPLALVVRWDSFLTGFERELPAYFSPAFLDAHSPGGELKLRLGEHVQLSAEAGPSFSLNGAAASSRGWFAGGGASVTFRHFSAAARYQAREEPWFASRRGWVELSANF